MLMIVRKSSHVYPLMRIPDSGGAPSPLTLYTPGADTAAEGGTAGSSITLVLNWPAGLNKQATAIR
jgi:hypothetical protein